MNRGTEIRASSALLYPFSGTLQGFLAARRERWITSRQTFVLQQNSGALRHFGYLRNSGIHGILLS